MVHWGFPKPRHSMPSLSPRQLHGFPQALAEQLALGGRLLIPVGESEQQLLQLVHRHADGTTSVRTLEGCRFVPLIGEQGFAA